TARPGWSSRCGPGGVRFSRRCGRWSIPRKLRRLSPAPLEYKIGDRLSRGAPSPSQQLMDRVTSVGAALHLMSIINGGPVLPLPTRVRVGLRLEPPDALLQVAGAGRLGKAAELGVHLGRPRVVAARLGLLGLAQQLVGVLPVLRRGRRRRAAAAGVLLVRASRASGQRHRRNRDHYDPARATRPNDSSVPHDGNSPRASRPSVHRTHLQDRPRSLYARPATVNRQTRYTLL